MKRQYNNAIGITSAFLAGCKILIQPVCLYWCARSALFPPRSFIHGKREQRSFAFFLPPLIRCLPADSYISTHPTTTSGVGVLLLSGALSTIVTPTTTISIGNTIASIRAYTQTHTTKSAFLSRSLFLFHLYVYNTLEGNIIYARSHNSLQFLRPPSIYVDFGSPKRSASGLISHPHRSCSPRAHISTNLRVLYFCFCSRLVFFLLLAFFSPTSPCAFFPICLDSDDQSVPPSIGIAFSFFLPTKVHIDLPAPGRHCLAPLDLRQKGVGIRPISAALDNLVCSSSTANYYSSRWTSRSSYSNVYSCPVPFLTPSRKTFILFQCSYNLVIIQLGKLWFMTK